MTTIDEVSNVPLSTDTHGEVIVFVAGDVNNITGDSIATNSETSFNLQDLSNSTADHQPSSIVDVGDDEKIICGENKVNGLESLGEENNKIANGGFGDGSDSGVEISGNLQTTNCILQRALSSNSGGYSSSCGGLEETNGMVSCDSSMLSYCSDLGESKLIQAGNFTRGGECYTSEGGSESSSVTGGPVSTFRIKKKVAMMEPSNRISPKRNSGEHITNGVGIKNRSSSNSRPPASSTKSGTPGAATRDRARSRDKVPPKTPTNRSTPVKRPPKPDSFPVDIKDPASPAIQRIRGSRTPSVTRGRTPGVTPTDDGRWPSVGSKNGGASTPKSARVPVEGLTIKTRIGAIALENTKTSTVDKFATLPRRRKEKSADDLKNRSPRSNSITRDNRMTNSMVKKQSSVTTPSKPALPPYPNRTTIATGSHKRPVPKTKIYHETSVQTAITCQDVDDAFSGAAKIIKIDAVETSSKHTQSDIRDKEMESLREQLNKMRTDYTNLQSLVTEKSQKISEMEKDLIQEREEKLAAQKELHANSERVLAMIESVHVPSSSLSSAAVAANTDGNNTGGDSLLILESQIMQSEHILEKQEAEITKWKRICSSLQNDMEKSLRAQRNLIQQRDVIEQESVELQDFLQVEKTTLIDALREVEVEAQLFKEKVAQKEVDLERLQEECRHLVRIGEQRRQENMGLQSKYSALEARSRELILQQGSAVSGASVALAGLGSRLDHLVEQLIASYNISEQELEDVIYHNEAYTNSGSSGEGSPEFELASQQTNRSDDGNVSPLTPQRGHSFISAVISAIKNATSTTSAKMNGSMKKMTSSMTASGTAAGNRTANGGDIGEESDSTEMLDSETEPCLMMENVLEDVQMPDSHSHNLVSTNGLVLSQIEMTSDMKRHGGDSLHNLSQAIENRQQIEFQSSMMANRSVQHGLMIRQPSDHSTSEDISVHESFAEMPVIADFCNAQTLVDQVIEVDNLVTKLLKVLRIIQMDNDNCIQQLITEKNRLQLNKEEMLEKLKEFDDSNVKLKNDLKGASENLLARNSELATSKIDLQNHRVEIDRLNEDICNLSTLCSQNNKNYNRSMAKSSKEDILATLKSWQESGNLPDPEIITHILNACNEIPELREKLHGKEKEINDMTNQLSNTKHLMTTSWHSSINDAKRQYEAIDRALEKLQSIQSIVEQCPVLSQLQRDLEETNFQSVGNHLPVNSHLTQNGSDLNANGTEDGSSSGPNSLQLDQSNNTHPIDSTA